MGSYNSDSHNIQRVPTADGAVENEGDMQVPVTPYQIPYRVMLPKKAQATNLLVPVCVSSNHTTAILNHLRRPAAGVMLPLP